MTKKKEPDAPPPGKAAKGSQRTKISVPRAKKPPVIDEDMLDEAFARSCDQVSTAGGYKESSIVGTDARKLLVGIPLPSLAVEMLIMCSCWPLARIFQLVGEEGCGKSTFLWEIIRWLFMHGGFAHVMENEGKDNAAVRDAILQYNEKWIGRRLQMDYTGSLDDWISRVRYNMEAATTHNAGLPTDGKETAAKRFGWRSPYGFFVDSFMSTSTDKQQEKINKDGSPGMDFAREANIIAKEGRTWAKRMWGTTFVFGGTNHMKPTTDRFGHDVPGMPGGKAIKFMEALEIHMHRTNAKLDGIDCGGYGMALFTQKNSFAPGKRSIEVNVLWEKEETDDPKHPRKRMYFDWHTATTEALLKFMTLSAGHKKAVMAVVDINLARNRRLWSDVLGIPEDDPVNYHSFGRAIDYNKEVRQMLRAVIGIEPMAHFRPGIPLKQTQELASYAADDALDLVYNDQNDPDLSGFADVTAQLARQAHDDKARVDKQRKAGAAAAPPVDELDDLFGDEFDD